MPMETTMNAFSRVAAWMTVLAAFSLLAMFLKADDPYFLFGLVFAIVLAFGLMRRQLSFSLLDGCVLVVYAYECFSLSVSVEPLLGVKLLCGSTLVVLYYFCLRLFVRTETEWRRLLLVYCTLAGVMSLVALASFYWFAEAIRSVEFDNLYEFRHLYRPLGLPDNDWAGVQLLFLGLSVWCMYANRHSCRMVCLCGGLYVLVFLLLLLSFSRGIYASLLLWMVGLFALFGLKKLRRWTVGLLVISCLAIASTSCFFGREMATVQMNDAVSQQRSTSGRLASWHVAADAVRERPWTGGGIGTYTRQTAPFYAEDTTMGYTSYASNIIAKLAVEQGLIGILIYTVLAITVLICSFRYGRVEYGIIGITLLVFVFREQTFSILFNSLPARWLIYTGLAFLVAKDGNSVPGRQKRGLRLVVVALPLFVWTGVEVFLMYEASAGRGRILSEVRQRNLKDNMQHVEQAKLLSRSGNKAEAIALLDSLAGLYPRNADYHWALHREYEALGNTDYAVLHLLRVIELEPRVLDTEWFQEMQSDSSSYSSLCGQLLARIRKRTEEDPMQTARDGKILLSLGQTEEAREKIVSALKRLPNLSMAWYNLGVAEEQCGHDSLAMLCKRRALTLESGMLVTTADVTAFEHQRPAFQVDDLFGADSRRYHFLCKEWYGGF